jgi:hypothetical protein
MHETLKRAREAARRAETAAACRVASTSDWHTTNAGDLAVVVPVPSRQEQPTTKHNSGTGHCGLILTNTRNYHLKPKGARASEYRARAQLVMSAKAHNSTSARSRQGCASRRIKSDDCDDNNPTNAAAAALSASPPLLKDDGLRGGAPFDFDMTNIVAVNELI